MLINKDQETPYKVTENFHDAVSRHDTTFTGRISMLTFGGAQYHWDPLRKVADSTGVLKSSVDAAGKSFELPAASVVVLGGKIADEAK